MAIAWEGSIVREVTIETGYIAGVAPIKAAAMEVVVVVEAVAIKAAAIAIESAIIKVTAIELPAIE